MDVLVTGASGVVGSALIPALAEKGHRASRLGRSPRFGWFQWDPVEGTIDEKALDGVDVVVNLAGANLSSGRWTEARKQQIRDSRVLGTRLLVDAMLKRDVKPGILLCASAVGFYGNTGDSDVDESAPPGSGFLAEVCQAWEQEAMRAADAGIRVVRMRTGIVLTPEGGALAKVLPVFKGGLGGPVGGGKQWMSWISIDDLVAAVIFLLETPDCSGAVNLATPNPVTNAEFASVLGRVLQRPTVAPVPASVLKLMYGAMAEETILSSNRVTPGKLMAAGFEYAHPDLESALRHVLSRPSAPGASES